MFAAALLIGTIMFLTGCGGSRSDPFVIDRTVASQDQAANLTLEAAAFLASGTLIDIYGLEADPVASSVQGEVVEFKAQLVWRLDLTVDVSEDGQRVQHQWEMWIGTPADGPPTALRARRVP